MSRDASATLGVAGLLAAIGLIPALVLPVVFATRKATLTVGSEGLRVGDRPVRFVHARVEPGPRGGARLEIQTRSGERRRFHFDVLADAQRVAAMLPPVSAPAGALSDYT